MLVYALLFRFSGQQEVLPLESKANCHFLRNRSQQAISPPLLCPRSASLVHYTALQLSVRRYKNNHSNKQHDSLFSLSQTLLSLREIP